MTKKKSKITPQNSMTDATLTAQAESSVGRARANAYLRRLRLVVELRLCASHGPPGVVVLPSLRHEHA